ncbi:MAG: MFS transporter [Ilumatobacteraceae bacterium]|jgi:MFS family permease
MFQRIRSAHYAWVIFVVAFITLLGAAGFRSTPGILIDPLGKEFGWSRATVATAVSINVLLFGFIGPFAAALQLRYGLRKVTITALVIISTGALATTQMTHPWHLYILWGGVVGVGSGCMATVFASTVASRWFVKRRGLVTGALTAASASGQLVFLPLLSRIAEQSGWRWVGVVIALCALAVIPVVFLFLRNSPADIGLLPYGASDDFVFATTLENPIRSAFNAFRDAKSDGTFWLLWGSFFVCGFSTNGLIQTHFISAAQDHLLVASVAAGYLALIGGFDVIGTIFSGWLTDRSDPTKLLLVYYLLRGLSLLVLDPMLNMKGWGLLGFMMFYGLDWVATVPPTVALCAQRFGPQRGPLVYGWVFAGHQVGAAVAAFGAGYLRDVTGSYKSSFIISGTGCLIAAYGVTRIDGKTPFNELQPVK